MPAKTNLSVPERLDRLEHAVQLLLTALHPLPRSQPPVTTEVEVGLTAWVHSLVHSELERFGGRLEQDDPTA